ncbi:MAG: hypothetical protein WAO18_09080, partial [Mycobacterium sp.]
MIATAGAALGFGLGPLAGAPSAHADILDVVVDPITQPLQQALAGVGDVVSAIDPSTGLDALAGLDPAAVLSSVDLSGVVDPASVLAGVDVGAVVDPSAVLSGVDVTGGLDVGAVTDVAGPLQAASDPLVASWGHGEWFNDNVYPLLHADMERWIDSPFGTRVDDFVNHVSGHFLIGNGTDGNAANPDGTNAGLLFGDGGNGYGPDGNGGDAGWIMGNGGNAGSASDSGFSELGADPAGVSADPTVMGADHSAAAT